MGGWDNGAGIVRWHRGCGEKRLAGGVAKVWVDTPGGSTEHEGERARDGAQPSIC